MWTMNPELVLIIAVIVAAITLFIDILVIYSIISANKHLGNIEEFCDWYYEKHKDLNK